MCLQGILGKLIEEHLYELPHPSLSGGEIAVMGLFDDVNFFPYFLQVVKSIYYKNSTVDKSNNNLFSLLHHLLQASIFMIEEFIS